MAAVIDQGEVARLRAHSAYWAPFVVVGEGGRGVGCIADAVRQGDQRTSITPLSGLRPAFELSLQLFMNLASFCQNANAFYL